MKKIAIVGAGPTDLHLILASGNKLLSISVLRAG